jgi:hypothetical protein
MSFDGGVARENTEYECGYCCTRKVHLTGAEDIQIRCECGGKHQDRVARMHAKWRRVLVAPKTLLEIEELSAHVKACSDESTRFHGHTNGKTVG